MIFHLARFLGRKHIDLLKENFRWHITILITILSDLLYLCIISYLCNLTDRFVSNLKFLFLSEVMINSFHAIFVVVTLGSWVCFSFKDLKSIVDQIFDEKKGQSNKLITKASKVMKTSKKRGSNNRRK